ncbi:MAG: hypothetical protein ABIG88_00075 [Patescibacteria group bacterium]
MNNSLAMVDETLEELIFLICKVRGAPPEILQRSIDYKEQKQKEGYSVHNPNTDTNQDDPIGYDICIVNKEAIRKSIEVHTLWDPTSTGSRFDLSMAFYASKKLVIANEDELKKPFDEYTRFLLKYSNSPLVRKSKFYNRMMEEKNMIMRQEEPFSFLIDTERFGDKKYTEGGYMNALYIFGLIFMADKPINLVNSGKLMDYELKKDVKLFKKPKEEGKEIVTKTFNKVLLCYNYTCNGGKPEDFYNKYLEERDKLLKVA